MPLLPVELIGVAQVLRVFWVSAKSAAPSRPIGTANQVSPKKSLAVREFGRVLALCTANKLKVPVLLVNWVRARRRGDF